MEGAFVALFVLYLSACAVAYAIALALSVPRWKRKDPEAPVAVMGAAGAVGFIVHFFLENEFAHEPYALFVSVVAGGVALGTIAGRRALDATRPLIGPFLLTVAMVPRNESMMDVMLLALLAAALFVLAAFAIGKVRWPIARLAVAAAFLVAPYGVRSYSEDQARVAEARAVQANLTGAIERSGLSLVFEPAPKVQWNPVQPMPAIAATATGTIPSRGATLDFHPGTLGIDFTLAAPLTMRVGEKSAMRVVDPAALRANGLRTDFLANLVKYDDPGDPRSVRHVGGPAKHFWYFRPDGATPLGEVFIRGDRIRIEVHGWASYTDQRLAWIASGGMSDPR